MSTDYEATLAQLKEDCKGQVSDQVDASVKIIIKVLPWMFDSVIRSEETQKQRLEKAAEFISALRSVLLQGAEASAAAKQLLDDLDRRTVKPRNIERDSEILRLREAEAKSFGQIGKLLKMKASTVRSAYNRMKQKQE